MDQPLHRGISAYPDHRADDLLLEVRPSNIAAMKLYFAEGFDQVGIRHAYYPAEEGSREDAVIMARSLKF